MFEKEDERYPWHENIVASVFWVGETAGEDNDNIDNINNNSAILIISEKLFLAIIWVIITIFLFISLYH